MPKIMTLPKIGVNMTKATIVEWAVKEGETVAEGQRLFDAETDKAVQEIPSTVSGILARILAQSGETINCYEPVAVFTAPGEVLSSDFSPPLGVQEEPTVPVQPQKESPSQPQVSLPITQKRVRISPIAKKMARRLSLDYLQIQPPRPGARIVKADVLAFARKQEETRVVPPAPVPPATSPVMGIREIIPLKSVRKVIADRMSASAHTTARAALFLRADVGELQKWRERLKQEGNPVSFNDLFVFLTARALREFPQMNSRLAGEAIHLMEDINIGVAIDTERGLVVPTIRQADRKGVLAISEDFRAKLDRARAGKSILEDLSGGTFTITNLGMLDIEGFIPVINPPESAILAIGSMIREPVVVDEKDTIKVRPMAQLCLVFDHRIVDGAPAARFLKRIKQLIEWPMGCLS